MAIGRNHRARLVRYFRFGLEGVAVGAMGMVMGAFLASGDNRWEYGLYHSAAGIVGAPLTALAWATHRSSRGQIFAGIALVIGFLSGMTMLFELTGESASITGVAKGSPVVFAVWFLIWAMWVSLAVARLIVIRPERTRQRLSLLRPSLRRRVGT
jgi:hypothetical protein